MIADAVKQGLLNAPDYPKPSPFYVYMTELAGCPRAYALKQSATSKPFTPEQLLTFADGSAQEDALIAALQRSELRVHETQKAVKLEIGRITLSGKIDAVVGRDEGERIALEIKSASPKVFDAVRQYGAQGQHRLQLLAYLVFGGFAQGVLLYKNRAAPDMIEFWVQPTSAEVLQMQGRPALFEAALERTGDDLPLAHLTPRELTDTQNVCRWCGFRERCFSGS